MTGVAVTVQHTTEIPSQLARIVRFLSKLVRGEFYGTVTIGFQRGQVSSVKTEQSHKADEL